MQKLILLVVALLVLVAVVPVAAQDEMVSCSPETITEVATTLDEGFTQYADLMDIPDEPTASDLTAYIVVADAFAYGYWEGFFEASDEGLCVEADWLGYTGGLVLDEMLITTQLAALTAYEGEAGETELATSLGDLATARLEALQEGSAAISEAVTGIIEGTAEINLDIPECSQEEIDATYEGLDEIYSAYEDLGTLTEDAEGADLSALIVGYGTLSSQYWTEFMPVVPSCLEAQNEAFTAGLVLDNSLIIVSLYRLSELEADMGDADVAATLEDSANVRYEELQAFLEQFAEE